jgi:hypothetical protein
VEHIDDKAVKALTRYYEEALGKLAEGLGKPKQNMDVLDVGSSW